MSGGLRLNIGNLDDVADGFAPLPEAVYNVQVQNAEVLTSKNNNQMVKLTMVVTDPGDHIGRKGFANLVLVPDALWKLKEFCKAAGIAWDQGGVDLQPAIGKNLRVKVTQETYEDRDGKTRITNRWDGFVVPA